MAAAIGEVCLACPASLAAALPADFTSCRPLHTLALGWKSFSLARGNISNISSLTPCVQAGFPQGIDGHPDQQVVSLHILVVHHVLGSVTLLVGSVLIAAVVVLDHLVLCKGADLPGIGLVAVF